MDGALHQTPLKDDSGVAGFWDPNLLGVGPLDCGNLNPQIAGVVITKSFEDAAAAASTVSRGGGGCDCGVRVRD